MKWASLGLCASLASVSTLADNVIVHTNDLASLSPATHQISLTAGWPTRYRVYTRTNSVAYNVTNSTVIWYITDTNDGQNVSAMVGVKENQTNGQVRFTGIAPSTSLGSFRSRVYELVGTNPLIQLSEDICIITNRYDPTCQYTFPTQTIGGVRIDWRPVDLSTNRIWCTTNSVDGFTNYCFFCVTNDFYWSNIVYSSSASAAGIAVFTGVTGRQAYVSLGTTVVAAASSDAAKVPYFFFVGFTQSVSLVAGVYSQLPFSVVSVDTGGVFNSATSKFSFPSNTWASVTPEVTYTSFGNDGDLYLMQNTNFFIIIDNEYRSTAGNATLGREVIWSNGPATNLYWIAARASGGATVVGNDPTESQFRRNSLFGKRIDAQ